MKIGTMELIVILLIAFLVLGPDRTIMYTRKLGKGLRTLRIYINSFTEDIRETVTEPLAEIQQPLNELAKPFEELSKPLEEAAKSIQQPVNELKSTVNMSEAKLNASLQGRGGSTKPDASAAEAAKPVPEEEELEEAVLVEEPVPIEETAEAPAAPAEEPAAAEEAGQEVKPEDTKE